MKQLDLDLKDLNSSDIEPASIVDPVINKDPDLEAPWIQTPWIHLSL